MTALPPLVLLCEGVLTKRRLTWLLSAAEGVVVAGDAKPAVLDAIPSDKMIAVHPEARSWPQAAELASRIAGDSWPALIASGLPFDAEAAVSSLEQLQPDAKSPLSVLFLAPGTSSQTVLASLPRTRGEALEQLATQARKAVGGSVLALAQPGPRELAGILEGGRADLLLVVRSATEEPGTSSPTALETTRTHGLGGGLNAASIVQVFVTDQGVVLENRSPFDVEADIVLAAEGDTEIAYARTVAVAAGARVELERGVLGGASELVFPQPERRQWSHSVETVYEGGTARLPAVAFRYYLDGVLRGSSHHRSDRGLTLAAVARDIARATDGTMET